MGIHSEQVNTHQNSGNYNPFAPIDEKFKAVTTEGVEQIYKTFVSHVAQGRKMSFTQVDAIAQGRVWTGADAIKIGLVDKIGGLHDAIQEAARLAKIKTFNTQNYPEYKKNFDDFLENFPFAKTKERWIKEEIGEDNYKMMEQIKRIQSYKGVQARMPFDINIQ
jgi:protease-4